MARIPTTKRVKIAFIGGGSQSWGPQLVRDIVLKKEMAQAELEIVLLDTNRQRAQAMKRLFDVLLARWRVDRVKITQTQDASRALKGADFVLIAISTGGLDAMRHDIEIPERYGIYHTVGDTVGPGGWARAMRNIPVFKGYARQIKELAPGAFVLNYTNPMGALTKVLADELGHKRVVGLCHGIFESRRALRDIFALKDESELKLTFGGLNHFIWILDFAVNGRNGYELLKKKLGDGTLADVLDRISTDEHGWSSRARLASELLQQYHCLPYLGDRHTCEFFGCYITDRKMMERFGLVRTSIEDRAASYSRAAQWIEEMTAGKSQLGKTPSRETAADIIAAIAFDRSFSDVVNMPNIGQIENMPAGAVVETMGHVDGGGASPLAIGPLPEQIRALCAAHAEVQLRTVEAALEGDMEEGLMALVADPVCARLTASDVKKMGRELLTANRHHLPQFFGGR